MSEMSESIVRHLVFCTPSLAIVITSCDQLDHFGATAKVG